METLLEKKKIQLDSNVVVNLVVIFIQIKHTHTHVYIHKSETNKNCELVCRSSTYIWVQT